MNRPNDIHGNPVEMGPWYWARGRTGKVLGVGKFASSIGHTDITWFINGTGYGWETFEFVKADEPDFEPGQKCEHGVKDGDYCEPCNREYKRAALTCERCDFPLVQGQSCPECEPRRGVVHAP